MSDPTDQRDLVEILGEQFLARHRRGERPTACEYADAHPEYADQILHLFPAMVAMERFKTCKQNSSERPIELQVDAPRQLGDYRIIREIGRGGMGVVYEAEQQSLARKVAVKVFPRQTMSDPRQLKRFHREARTAARLHHTNIVPVHDVGEHEGQHYYVMQRIHGIGLDAIIKGITETESTGDLLGDTNQRPELSASTRSISDISVIDLASDLVSGKASARISDNHKPLRSIADLITAKTRRRSAYWRSVANIGIQVSAALSYAHAQGVFHRDIKPGNLMLDAQGTVWVMDFGLAVAVETEKLSNPGDILGTLRFMAPEHLQGDHDARSDVYSLGLSLYELLTMQPAFKESNRAQLAHKISQGEILRPRALRGEIPSDLEAIVVRAIARQPHRRYQTAAELGDDLRCFLEDRPVRARRIGSAGRAHRWMRRNPAIASLSLALLVVLIMSLVSISAKWREAVQEYQRADANLALALDSMDEILERFAANWMAHPAAPQADDGESGFDFRMVASDRSAAMLEDALKFYDQFAEQNSTNPRLQLDTAKAHRRVGDIHERLGQYADAEQAYRRSVKIMRDHSKEFSDDPEVIREHSVTLNQLGLVLYWTSRFEEAKEQFLRAKTILADEQTRHDRSSLCQYELAKTYTNLGHTFWLLRSYREAGQSHRKSVELLRRLVDQHPRNSDFRLALARAFRSYYPFVSREERDTNVRSDAILILEELVEEFPDVPDYQCELSEMLATSRRGSSDAQIARSRSNEFERAVTIAQELTAKYPAIPRYRAALAGALRAKGDSLQRARDVTADASFAESVDHYRSLASDFPTVRAYQFLLALTLQQHGAALGELGRLSESRDVLQEAIAQQKTNLSLRSQSYFEQRMLVRQYETLAKTLRDLGDSSGADQANHEATQLRERLEVYKHRHRAQSST